VIHPAVGCHCFPPVTFPAADHHRPLAGTILYCLLTEAHVIWALRRVLLTMHNLSVVADVTDKISELLL